MTADEYIKYLQRLCKQSIKDPVKGSMDDIARNGAYENIIASIEVFQEKYDDNRPNATC